jgi:hypothetical protein
MLDGIPLAHRNSAWRMTGAISLRPSLCGGVMLYLEETRDVFRPFYTDHTPANWRTERRFRRARMHELDELLRALDRRRQT